MFDYVDVAEAYEQGCQIERCFNASPESVLAAWRDPALFEPDLTPPGKFDVTLRRRPNEARPTFIQFGKVDGPVQEHLPLRIAFETTPDLALMVIHSEAAPGDLSVCLTLVVATEPGLTGKGQKTTPCVLMIEPPPLHYRRATIDMLERISKRISEYLEARDRRARAAREAARQKRIAEGQIRKAERAKCRGCLADVMTFKYEGEEAAAYRCARCQGLPLPINLLKKQG